MTMVEQKSEIAGETMPSSDRRRSPEKNSFVRVILGLTVEKDRADALVSAARRDFGARDITVEVVEAPSYNFCIGRAIENFQDFFHSKNERVPAVTISDLGPARISTLSHMAEHGYATMETLYQKIPNLDVEKAKAVVRDLLRQGKISRIAKGVYFITDIEEAYHDEIVEFRLIIENFKPTKAESQILKYMNVDTNKAELIKAMSVSRQRIDQLISRLVNKGLVTVDDHCVRRTIMGDIIVDRSSIYPL